MPVFEVEDLDDRIEELRNRFPRLVEQEETIYRFDGKEYYTKTELINALIDKGIVTLEKKVVKTRRNWYLEIDGVLVDIWQKTLTIKTYSDDQKEHKERVDKVMEKLIEVIPEISDVKCVVHKSITEECRLW